MTSRSISRSDCKRRGLAAHVRDRLGRRGFFDVSPKHDLMTFARLYVNKDIHMNSHVSVDS